MKIACITSIVVCAILCTILLIQVVGEIAHNLADRHYDKYHNFDTIWWYIEHALDPFII